MFFSRLHERVGLAMVWTLAIVLVDNAQAAMTPEGGLTPVPVHLEVKHNVAALAGLRAQLDPWVFISNDSAEHGAYRLIAFMTDQTRSRDASRDARRKSEPLVHVELREQKSGDVILQKDYRLSQDDNVLVKNVAKDVLAYLPKVVRVPENLAVGPEKLSLHPVTRLGVVDEATMPAVLPPPPPEAPPALNDVDIALKNTKTSQDLQVTETVLMPTHNATLAAQPWLRLQAGLTGLYRTYSGLDGATQKFGPVPAVRAHVEFYPIRESWSRLASGLGIYVEGYALHVQTNLNNQDVTADMMSLNGGIAYRLPWVQRFLPEITFRSGYQYMRSAVLVRGKTAFSLFGDPNNPGSGFTLQTQAIPTLDVRALTTGVEMALPARTRVQAVLGANYLWPTMRREEQGMMYRTQAGLRVTTEPLVVELMSHYEIYEAQNSNNRVVGGHVSAGVVL